MKFHIMVRIAVSVSWVFELIKENMQFGFWKLQSFIAIFFLEHHRQWIFKHPIYMVFFLKIVLESPSYLLLPCYKISFDQVIC